MGVFWEWSNKICEMFTIDFLCTKAGSFFNIPHTKSNISFIYLQHINTTDKLYMLLKSWKSKKKIKKSIKENTGLIEKCIYVIQ